MTTKTRPVARSTTLTKPTPKPTPRADACPEDTGNIVALEHVNVTIPDNRLANIFYILGMGFTRDPHFLVGPDNMWVNLGDNQFHLPLREAQVVRGRIGIVMPSLDQLDARLQGVAAQLKGTKFAWTRKGDRMHVTCPWGNTLIVYEPGPRFGAMRLGIPYVEFDVAPETAKGIARFYRQVLEAPATTTREGGLDVTRIAIGSTQEFIFRETRQAIRPYDGHHVAIYVANMSHGFDWFQSRGLLMEGLRNHQYRFKQLTDPESSEPLFELEHEVRSMKHPMYMRTLVNRDPNLTMAGYMR